jgi:Ig-like domain from next to BRCA1 gene
MSRLKFFAGGLGVILLLSACTPATAQPAGPSAEEMKAMVATSVELTVSAYGTEQAALIPPTPTPTDTPPPTATLIFPTLTPFPTPTQYIPGGGVAPTPSEYACAVVNKSPADNSIFKPKKDFDIKFYLRNIGTKRWDKGADLLFQGGTNMLTTHTAYELPKVEPGETVGPFIFDARSPNKAGVFTMTFKVQGGFCYPYIKIVVQK